MTPVHTHLSSPLGDLLVIGTHDGVSGLYFPGHRRGRQAEPTWDEDPAAFTQLAAQLRGYFDRQRRTFDVPVVLSGTPFQQAVWQALAAIPYGTTTTYGRLAASLGRATSARAVAGAVARNPVSILVPCHRVVAGNGAITGYAGGVERKRHLLDLEGTLIGHIGPPGVESHQ